MKTTTLPLLLSGLFFLLGCQPKPQPEALQSGFLSPDIMCGTVQFADGCSPKLDSLLRFGIALVHHMTYEDARYTFDRVIREDPDCFWGHWGKAMTYIHPLWPDVPSKEEMASGYALAQRARSLARTDKERLYAETIAAYYTQDEKNKRDRLVAFQAAWAEAAAQLPDDIEAQLFNGLMRLSVVPPTDKSYTVQTEVGTLAEETIKTYQDHPGAFHYGIHAYDVPPLAERAVNLARKYGQIAPEIPHALHMPSHIFTRLGYWQESIDWNDRSARAAIKSPVDGKVSGHYYHALDYMVYALLQHGEDDRARALVASMDTLSMPPQPAPTAAYALGAMEARLALENQDWKAAANLPEPDTSEFAWGKFPQYEALVHFARGIGAARSGQTDAAAASLLKLRGLQSGLDNTPPNQYWKDQMEIQIQAVEAWNTYALGHQEAALGMMADAAELEYRTQKNPVSPGTLVPAGELLGDMYLAAGRPKDALAAYERSLKDNPNRFNSLYSAGQAAEQAGDAAMARNYYSQVGALKGKTETKRERMAYARQAVSTM